MSVWNLKHHVHSSSTQQYLLSSYHVPGDGVYLSEPNPVLPSGSQSSVGDSNKEETGTIISGQEKQY